MNYIRYMGIVISLAITQLGAAELVTLRQNNIYPQNPHLVKSLGNEQTPQEKENYIAAMKKASNFVHKASWTSVAMSFGSLAILLNVESTAAKVAAFAGASLCATAAFFLNKISAVQMQMAHNEELITATIPKEAMVRAGDVAQTLIDIADGVYIFSTTWCPPCKLLHAALPVIRDALPNLAFFEYDTNDAKAQSVIQCMGINANTIPLTVVVENGIITTIIHGYKNNPTDLIQKINMALTKALPQRN